METGSSGPPWLTISVAVLSLAGVVITAVIGPIFVDRRRSGSGGAKSPESAVITRLADGAVALIQSEITDLQMRIRRLEAQQMAGTHDHR